MRPFLLLLILVPTTLAGMALQAILLLSRAPQTRTLPVRYHRFLCRILGIRVVVKGALAAERPLFVAANHISWLDIPVLSSIGPVSFIAKSEVAGWPFFGWLAKLQRSIFVDRSRRHATSEANEEIAKRLAEGDVIVLFAEGTSSDGNRVLPFRTALLGAARDAAGAGAGRVYIQPISVAYTRLWGLPMGRLWRPRVAWYGDMRLAPHLWGVLKQSAIDVTVTLGPPIAFDAADDRKRVARSAETFVRRATISALTGRGPADTVMEPL
jgi:lyso-ornithine lipid O-acyltransferase